jgi:thioredoxin reductase
MKTFDAVIVGGGPGGLAGALALGRGRASTLLVDGGTPRNARAHAVHTFVTRDGTPPKEFRAMAREQLREYPNVEVRDALVTRIEKHGDVFEVRFGDESVRAWRILLTTGVHDVLPAIPGLAELWGRTVFQCPYCHGWELRDRPWGVLVDSELMAAMPAFVTNWGSHVTGFTNGTALSPEARAKLDAHGVTVRDEPIAALRGTNALEAVELATGTVIPCEALLMRPLQKPVPLVIDLGLDLDDNGFVKTSQPMRESSVPGIHVAGDAGTMMQSAIVAASEGTTAAAMMNHLLVEARHARAKLER